LTAPDGRLPDDRPDPIELLAENDLPQRAAKTRRFRWPLPVRIRSYQVKAGL